MGMRKKWKVEAQLAAKSKEVPAGERRKRVNTVYTRLSRPFRPHQDLDLTSCVADLLPIPKDAGASLIRN
jgi:hypothetical protein